MHFPGAGPFGELAGDAVEAPRLREGPAIPGLVYIIAVLPEGVLTRTGTTPGAGEAIFAYAQLPKTKS